MAPECQVVEMTPEMAEAILANNSRNRSLRKDYVRKLAGAIRRGEWALNGEPIQIADDGTLLNGQHRLSAVLETGETVPVLLVRGLPASTRRTMDSGTRRNLSDVLALHGETHTTNLGAAIGLLYRYRTDQKLSRTSRTAPTPQQALDLLDREPGLREALKVGRRVHRATGMRASVAALMFHLFEETDPGEGKAFFDALCHVENEPEGSPVRALWSNVDRARAERGSNIPTYVLSAMTIKAFNAWREGRELTLLFFRPGGKSPEVFPEIAPRASEAAAEGAAIEVPDSTL